MSSDERCLVMLIQSELCCPTALSSWSYHSPLRN
jgi:hypothetical protein